MTTSQRQAPPRAVDAIEIVAGRIVARRAAPPRPTARRPPGCGRRGPSSQTSARRRDRGRGCTSSAPCRAARRAAAAPSISRLEVLRGLLDRRMMDQHDAEAVLRARSRPACRRAAAAGRRPDRPVASERRRRHRRSTARSAPAARAGARTESVLAVSRRACSRPSARCDAATAAAHIGVVIAGHERHVGRRARALEPGARRRVFPGQRQS